MKNKKLKNWSVGIFHFTFGQLVYFIEITIQSEFNVLMALFFTKHISLFAND